MKTAAVTDAINGGNALLASWGSAHFWQMQMEGALPGLRVVRLWQTDFDLCVQELRRRGCSAEGAGRDRL